MRSRQLRQISICQFSSCSWSLLEDLNRYRALGYDSIGIWQQKVEDYGTEAAIDLIYESKMQVSSLHWTGGFTGDGQTYDFAINDAIDSIHLASKLQANCLLIHPGSQNGHLVHHANRLLNDALNELLPIAEALDVQLVVEPILDQVNSPFTFHSSIEETIKLMEAHPTLGIALDLYHAGMDLAALERLPEYAQRIKLVQLADRSRTSWTDANKLEHCRTSFRQPLGTGEIDLHKWLSRLSQFGYQGAFEVELHGPHIYHECEFDLLDRTSVFLNLPTVRRAMATRPINTSQTKSTAAKTVDSRANS
jgi:sugar phosphate isomerase/epimerase